MALYKLQLSLQTIYDIYAETISKTGGYEYDDEITYLFGSKKRIARLLDKKIDFTAFPVRYKNTDEDRPGDLKKTIDDIFEGNRVSVHIISIISDHVDANEEDIGFYYDDLRRTFVPGFARPDGLRELFFIFPANAVINDLINIPYIDDVITLRKANSSHTTTMQVIYVEVLNKNSGRVICSQR